MREQLEARLVELMQEYEVGERRLREVDFEQARLRETLVRMSGAIQVLREILESAGSSTGAVPGSTPLSDDGREHAAAAAAADEAAVPPP